MFIEDDSDNISLEWIDQDQIRTTKQSCENMPIKYPTSGKIEDLVKNFDEDD